MGFLQQHRVAGDDTGNIAERHGKTLDAGPNRGQAAAPTAVSVIERRRSDGLVAILQRRIAARRPLPQRYQ